MIVITFFVSMFHIDGPTVSTSAFDQSQYTYIALPLKDWLGISHEEM